MKCFTGYFAKLKVYENDGLLPVAICGKSPEFYKGLEYKKFAPTKDIFFSWKNGWITDEEYTKRFKTEILDNLDKKEIIENIKSLNRDIIFLCYEKPLDFCHRHIVAKWLREECDIHCVEYAK